MLRASILTIGLLVGFTGTAFAAAPGEIGPASGHTQNGRELTPAGRLTTLGNFPTGGALTPDGRFYWAANSGHGRNSVSVVDVATGAVVQTLPLPGAYVGVAFSPDGTAAYVTGAATGDPTPGGPTKGGAGDEIHTFTVDPATGKGTESDVVDVAPPTPKGRARTDSLIPTAKVYPEGLDVSPDGKTLVVALNQGDQVALVDTATRAVRFVDVGLYPFSALVDKDSKRAFVTNELSGTVSVVDLAAGSVIATVPVGGPPGDPKLGGPLGDFNSHPEGMALDPTRELLYVAVASRDLVAVVNTRMLKAERYVSVGRSTALGTSPVALDVTPDGRTLFVADANEDALAAIALTDRVVTLAPAIPGGPGRAVVGRFGWGSRHSQRPSPAGSHRLRAAFVDVDLPLPQGPGECAAPVQGRAAPRGEREGPRQGAPPVPQPPTWLAPLALQRAQGRALRRAERPPGRPLPQRRPPCARGA